MAEVQALQTCVVVVNNANKRHDRQSMQAVWRETEVEETKSDPVREGCLSRAAVFLPALQSLTALGIVVVSVTCYRE